MDLPAMKLSHESFNVPRRVVGVNAAPFSRLTFRPVVFRTTCTVAHRIDRRPVRL